MNKINNDLYKQAESLAIMSPYTIKFWVEILTNKINIKDKINNGIDLEVCYLLDINLLNQYGAWNNEN